MLSQIQGFYASLMHIYINPSKNKRRFNFWDPEGGSRDVFV